MKDICTYQCGGFGQKIGGDAGVDPEIQKGVARTLTSYIDTFYFTENSLKVTENITEKRVAMDPLDPTPKSTHWIYSIKLGPNNFSVHFHSFVGARATSCNISGCYWLY